MAFEFWLCQWMVRITGPARVAWCSSSGSLNQKSLSLLSQLRRPHSYLWLRLGLFLQQNWVLRPHVKSACLRWGMLAICGISAACIGLACFCYWRLHFTQWGLDWLTSTHDCRLFFTVNRSQQGLLYIEWKTPYRTCSKPEAFHRFNWVN